MPGRALAFAAPLTTSSSVAAVVPAIAAAPLRSRRPPKCPCPHCRGCVANDTNAWFTEEAAKLPEVPVQLALIHIPGKQGGLPGPSCCGFVEWNNRAERLLLLHGMAGHHRPASNSRLHKPRQRQPCPHAGSHASPPPAHTPPALALQSRSSLICGTWERPTARAASRPAAAWSTPARFRR